VAAFPIPSVQPYALKLAKTNPAQGATVFLIAQLAGDTSAQNLVHHGQVVSINKYLMRFEYASPAFKLQATSGAPVVNELGQVVGVNVGGTERDGKYIGIAINLDTLTQALGSIRQ
jgi:S1-C subfamily serine protease